MQTLGALGDGHSEAKNAEPKEVEEVEEGNLENSGHIRKLRTEQLSRSCFFHSKDVVRGTTCQNDTDP